MSQVQASSSSNKILGDLGIFLGLEIARYSSNIYFSQCKYTLSLLEDTGFLDSKPAALPMEANVHLNAFDGDPIPN